MPRVMLKVKAEDVVVVTENHGGYTAGHCSACGAMGWIDGHGYPHHAKDVMGNRLKHKPKCPMNAHLNADGSIKK